MTCRGRARTYQHVWPEPRRLPRRSIRAALGTRFQPPFSREGIVPRAALVERMTSWNMPVIAVVAPPGYGKTTLLAQWAERRAPHVAWVACDQTDNDPAALWHAVATSINAAAPVGPAPARVLAAPGGGIDVVPAFVAAIEVSGRR